MGYNDAIKATASAGYTSPADKTFKTNNYMTAPATTNRLPGESDSAYLYRLTAIERRNKVQQKMQEAIQYQKEKLARQEEHEKAIRQENTKNLKTRYNALLSGLNLNDLASLRQAQSEYSSMYIDYTFNPNDFEMFDLKKTNSIVQKSIENLEKGEENNSYINRPDSRKNAAGFNFKPQFQQDMLG